MAFPRIGRLEVRTTQAAQARYGAESNTGIAQPVMNDTAREVLDMLPTVVHHCSVDFMNLWSSGDPGKSVHLGGQHSGSALRVLPEAPLQRC